MANLREVRVTYSNNEVIETSVNGKLTDNEIKEYFKIGKVFNIGLSDDKLVSVVEVEILK
jgi:hypothetical protein